MSAVLQACASGTPNQVRSALMSFDNITDNCAVECVRFALCNDNAQALPVLKAWVRPYIWYGCNTVNRAVQYEATSCLEWCIQEDASDPPMTVIDMYEVYDSLLPIGTAIRNLRDKAFYLLWRHSFHDAGDLHAIWYDRFVYAYPQFRRELVDIIVANGVNNYMKDAGKSSLATELFADGHISANSWKKKNARTRGHDRSVLDQYTRGFLSWHAFTLDTRLPSVLVNHIFTFYRHFYWNQKYITCLLSITED